MARRARERRGLLNSKAKLSTGLKLTAEQLTAEAGAAFNAWLEQHRDDYPDEAPVLPAEIKLMQVRKSLREPPEKWVAYVGREQLEDLGAGESAASPIAALRLFIAWTRGAS